MFSADGLRVAYLAAVPEPGRYGTDGSGTEASGRSGNGAGRTKKGSPAHGVGGDGSNGRSQRRRKLPRRIDRLSYRLDGEGFVADKPKQVFMLDPLGDTGPLKVTDEPSGAVDPVFDPAGRLLYSRSTGVDELTEEIAVVDLPDELAIPGSVPVAGRLLVSTLGSAAMLATTDSEILYLGVDFTGFDAVGRTTGSGPRHCPVADRGGSPTRSRWTWTALRAARRWWGRRRWSPSWTGERARCGRCRWTRIDGRWTSCR